MRIGAWIVVALLLSQQVHAQRWEPVAKQSVPTRRPGISIDLAAYLDLDSLIKQGNLVHMWTLVEIPTPQEMFDPPYSNVHSVVTLSYVDCEAKTIREIGDQLRTGPMGRGELVESNTHSQDQTKRYSPTEKGNDLIRMACAWAPKDSWWAERWRRLMLYLSPSFSGLSTKRTT